MFDFLISDLKGFISKPGDQKGDLFSWFLFVGFWVLATILWTRVIRRLAD